jgi:rsbT co-antagonist protein RsbR
MAQQHLVSEYRQFPLSEQDIERRKRYVALDRDDIARIISLKPLMAKHADAFVDSFFTHLSNIGESPALLSQREVLAEARRLKREHLEAMVVGDYSRAYVEQRIRLALLYSKYGVQPRIFLGAFHQLMRAIGLEIMKGAKDPQDAFLTFMSLKKVGFFDIGIIIDVLIAENERTISLQQDAIRELSTPVLQVRDRLLILPIIGTIDTQRAKQLTDSLLRAIRANRAKVVVMDITGVAAVDSKVANHLLQTVAAARLMGTTVIVSGLSADVAQALVALGVDLGKINTVGDLQGGLEEAELMLGARPPAANGAAGAEQKATA